MIVVSVMAQFQWEFKGGGASSYPLSRTKGSCTYTLCSVCVSDTLTIKDESNAVLGLAHSLSVCLLELGELGSSLDLKEYFVSIGVLDLDVELFTALGLWLRSFCVGHCDCMLLGWVYGVSVVWC